MRRLCVGDIHGCYDKLNDVLDKCKFSDSDILYSVGDFTDRGTQNVKTLDFLMNLKNFKPVCGNHDLWNYEYLYGKISTDAFKCWVGWNGGRKTYDEEKDKSLEWKESVVGWMSKIPYRIDLGDKIIVHSICNNSIYDGLCEPVDDITMKTLKTSKLVRNDIYDETVWGRDMLPACRGFSQIGKKEVSRSELDYYRKFCCDSIYNGKKVYIIGHTPLNYPFFDKELGIIGIDTGAFCTKQIYGIDGYLTILDIDTFEYWQSGKKGSFQL